MEYKKIKCSSKEHEQIHANIYCRKCDIFMCKKCESIHSHLCQNHQTFLFEKDIEEIFTGFCKEKEHNDELQYFCKTHNQLCCAACIAKIQNKETGNHKDCDVCIIEEIKDIKKYKLNENIKKLKEFSNIIEESINLKRMIDTVNENKEKLKLNIQKIITKIRNELNNREDEILLAVDKEFNNNYFNNEIMKDLEKLPKKVEISLEQGKKVKELDKNNNKLSFYVYNCIKIEKNINEINVIKENIKKCYNSKYLEIKFYPSEDEISKFLESIKSFGQLNIIKNTGFFQLSSIIKDDFDKQNSIIKWIKEKVNKNEIKFELIFKMKENGSDSEDFHKFCDKKGPTLTLVKTTKNKIFGGFTPLEWEKNKSYLNDESEQTFIFSLNLMKKYDMLNNGDYAIYNDEGPWFGDCDFGLKKNMKEGETYANESCNFLSDSNLELTGGKGESEYFETEELEIYKVIF